MCVSVCVCMNVYTAPPTPSVYVFIASSTHRMHVCFYSSPYTRGQGLSWCQRRTVFERRLLLLVAVFVVVVVVVLIIVMATKLGDPKKSRE